MTGHRGAAVLAVPVALLAVWAVLGPAAAAVCLGALAVAWLTVATTTGKGL
ncbi:hypothetical protein [Motilibacter aurantiacus]|uniref:hypothetical protein n=1 Tax=Motilibacter aurantiacus TaxID=2714955 RepID=UPI0014093E98|nr:hypothetical protein [Motilibacter aurantiacus]NHC47275.1 hypothetical protein [Motilibacter aurantiacus]